jgi:hypothetical protein
MELLGDVGHGKSCFSNRFGRTRWYSEVMSHKWNLVLVLFVYSSNLDAR